MIIVCRPFTGSSTPRSTTPTRSPRRSGVPRSTGPPSGSSGSSSWSACWPGSVWFILRHPLLDVAAGVLVLAWYQAGWPGVIAAVTSAAGCWCIVRIVWPGWFTRLVTVPARCRWRWWWCYRRRWRAVLTIAGLGPKYRGQVTLPVLGQGPGWAVHGPGGGAAGVRAVAEAVRRPGRGAGARVRRALLPGPHRPAREGGAGVRPPRRPGGGDPGPADPRGAGSAGAAGGPVRGRGTVHDPAARHAPADRRLHRRGQRLLPVGPGPGAAARDGSRAGAGACL